MGKHEKKKLQEYRNRVKSSKRQLKKQKREKKHRCMCSSMSCPDGNTSDSSSLFRPNWTFGSESKSGSDSKFEHDKETLSESSSDQSTSDDNKRKNLPYKTDPLYIGLMEYSTLKRRIKAIELASRDSKCKDFNLFEYLNSPCTYIHVAVISKMRHSRIGIYINFLLQPRYTPAIPGPIGVGDTNDWCIIPAEK